jgi:hypothetical protein
MENIEYQNEYIILYVSSNENLRLHIKDSREEQEDSQEYSKYTILEHGVILREKTFSLYRFYSFRTKQFIKDECGRSTFKKISRGSCDTEIGFFATTQNGHKKCYLFESNDWLENSWGLKNIEPSTSSYSFIGYRDLSERGVQLKYKKEGQIKYRMFLFSEKKFIKLSDDHKGVILDGTYFDEIKIESWLIACKLSFIENGYKYPYWRYYSLKRKKMISRVLEEEKNVI